MADVEPDEGRIEQEEQYFNGEDEIQDWKRFSNFERNQGVIPKRGDKDFEPDGTDIQAKQLKESQDAMYHALEESSHHRLRQLLVGIWMTREKKVLVPHAKGAFFKDIGKATKLSNNVHGVWINPIEAVYLVERGSMAIYLWNFDIERFLLKQDKGDQDIPEGETPISIGHLYVLVFGSDPNLYDKYQVYAYLKRFGYLVQDFSQLDGGKPQADEYQSFGKNLTLLENKKANLNNALKSVLSQIWSLICNSSIGKFLLNLALRIGIVTLNTSDLHFRTKHYFNYTSVFETLKLIPSYRALDSLNYHPSRTDETFRLAFNVWKPYLGFSKNKPPLPDFQVCIVNTEKHLFPRLQDFHYLFNELNYDFGKDSRAKKPSVSKKISKTRKFQTKREVKTQRRMERESRLDSEEKKYREYQRLRADKFKNGSSGRSLILALIQNGVINFMEVKEGDFILEGPLVNDLNELYKRNHGIVYIDE